MADLIGSTYELLEEIGSGGGGVVYLANHTRLNKKVVLKADKRKVTTSSELLRREVDILKDLSHPYIPKVYDFFIEGETVYTAIDYIDGISLDKALERDEHYSQPQIIEWAIQLLKALDYLHSPVHGTPPRGYVHSDIKPANIMLRENGDICLIDFNISLALGEKNLIGISPGYASPEHYGLDYSGKGSDTEPIDETELLDENGGTMPMHTSGRASTGKKVVVPDVRSDIYSLGATLYHLFGGKRPAKNAEEVIPLTEREVSLQIAEIIAKAMTPDPDERYQSAAEMLYAFEHLHENDPRSKRHKKNVAITAGILAAMFVLGGSGAFAGLKSMQRAEEAARVEAQQAQRAEQAAKEALAAIGDARSALQSGDAAAAKTFALRALQEDSPYMAQAQEVLTDALGVYDLSDGFKEHRTAELPSAPLRMVIAPDGETAAVLYAYNVAIVKTDSGEIVEEIPVQASALSQMLFLDNNVLIYAGADGLAAYDTAAQKQLWTGERATAIALSADGSTVAAVYKDEMQAFVYDAKSGKILKTVDFNGRHQSVATNDSFVDPQDNLFAISGDGRFLAVSFSDGSLWVYDLVESGRDLELYTDSHYTHFEGGFFDRYFAFVSTAVNDSVFAVIDAVAMEQTGGFASTFPFHTQADESGVYVATENILVKIDPVTGEQTEMAYTHTDIETFARSESHTLVTTSDGTFSVFDRNAQLIDKYEGVERCDFAALAGEYMMTASADSPIVRIMKLESNADAQILTYDPAFVHDEARISADGKTVMLFRYDSFRLYAADGTILTEVELPDAEQVYDQQYRRDEGYLEVFYYDGLIRRYSAKDGSLIAEEKGTAPDESLYEEFFTDTLKITSPLHGTPAAYDRQSGELICELEPDAYLTYVTQVGEYVVTEYISVHGDRYALLLDGKCQTLARMPELCDVLPDGTLLFDDMSGNLRQGRIHSLGELIAMAEG